MAVIMHNYPVQIEQTATETTLLPVYGSKSDYQPEVIQKPDYNVNKCKNAFDLLMTSGLNVSQNSDGTYFSHFGDSNSEHDAQIEDILSFPKSSDFSISISGALLTLQNTSTNGDKLTFIINNPSTTALTIIKDSIDSANGNIIDSLRNTSINANQISTIDKQLEEYSNAEYKRMIKDCAWYLTQREVVYIDGKDGDKPYYSKWDIFQSGNELVKEGKIKGQELKKPKDMKDFIPEAVPGCNTECGSFKGILWGFPPKPEPKKQEEKKKQAEEKNTEEVEKAQKSEEVRVIKQSTAEISNKADDETTKKKEDTKPPSNPLINKLKIFGVIGSSIAFVLIVAILITKSKSKQKKTRTRRRKGDDDDLL